MLELVATDLVAVRKAHPDYFVRGVFRDCVGLEVSKGARGYLIEREDGGGRLINLWAPGTEPGVHAQASLRLPGGPLSAKPVFPSDLAMSTDGSWIHLAWTGPVATVLSA